MRVIVAPEIVETTDPVIFLAGPTQGPATWRDDAIRMLQRQGDGFLVASPQRPWKVYDNFADEMYNEQVDWETRYLRQAGRNGVVYLGSS